MARFVLCIGDGNGAASRGTEEETFYFLVTDATDCESAINSLSDEIRDIDRFDSFDDYLENKPNGSYADYLNNYKDPSGGDIYLYDYACDGKLSGEFTLENLQDNWNGYFGGYNIEDPNNVAGIFGYDPNKYSGIGSYESEMIKYMLKPMISGKGIAMWEGIILNRALKDKLQEIDPDIKLVWCSGKDYNKVFNLTGDNAYKDDLNLLFVQYSSKGEQYWIDHYQAKDAKEVTEDNIAREKENK